MSVVMKLKELLEKEHINYQTLEHNLAYTGLEIAEAQHLPGHQVVKSVVVNADDKWILCVLPSTRKIDFEKLKKALSVKEVYLADEGEVVALFPGYEVGAMPPFGRFAGIPLYVDNSLKENEAIAFNAGTHTDMIKIKFKDYTRIAQPTFADFTIHI